MRPNNGGGRAADQVSRNPVDSDMNIKSLSSIAPIAGRPGLGHGKRKAAIRAENRRLGTHPRFGGGVAIKLANC